MFFVNILGKIMAFLYRILGNYGISIIIFTLISKIILLPLSILVQKNSIKMVKIQPKINKIKIDYFGDKDKQADEEAKLYKEEGYNAFASLIPLFIQIVLLIGLVEVINHPITHIVSLPKNEIQEVVDITLKNNKKLSHESSSLEIETVKAIKNNLNILEYQDILKEEKLNKIKKLDLNFLGFNLSYVATIEKGIAYLIPIIAGLSALILCLAQNKINILQIYQSKFNKYGMLIISVILSLYLGLFVPAGVALYWTASNLFAIIQQWLLNIFINPKKYVNKEELEKTSKELKSLMNLNKEKRTKEQIKKEKEDYKRFFKIINKHLVFYSESNGFYKYYKGIIEYILDNTNIIIHYITSDYNDNIFKLEKENSRIKAYYIEEKKLITLMMKMDADVVVMTMPDLQNYHIKRSYIRKDIEYIYIPHGVDSLNMTMRNKSMNSYDTVFVTGKHQEEEMIETNKLYDLKDRKIFRWGYSLLDDMIKNYNHKEKKLKKKTVLIAPSWQKDNIIDLCLDDILKAVINKKYDVIIRPHPQHVRHMKEKFNDLKEKYKNTNITIQTDFSKTDTVYNADLMITDWSSIAYEYAWTTKKPVIFIDTPMKIMNPEYQKIKVEPFNIWSRDKMGVTVKLNELNNLDNIIKEMLDNPDKYQKIITKLLDESVFNLGCSSEVGAKYIIEAVQKKVRERSKK